jgi:hypothetical protein
MAIYRPTNLQPNSIAIDTDDNNNFTCVIQGNVVVEYRINIRRVTNNAIVYTSGDVTLTTPLYNGDVLTAVVPSTANLDNGTDYKWDISVKETASSTAVTSSESRFFARTDPQVRITNIPMDGEINVRNFVLEGSYTQAEGVSLRYQRWILYDNDLNVLEDTGKIFNANLRYDYNRYLNGQTYYAELIIENQDGVLESSNRRGFNVVYNFPEISTSIMAENNPADNSIRLNLANATQIPGTGTNFSYLNNIPFSGTNSVKIGQDGSVTYGTRNGEDFNSLGRTAFIHTSFENNIWDKNVLNHNNGTLNGVFGQITNQRQVPTGGGGSTSITDDWALVFEDYIFKVYFTSSITSMWILVNQYPVYNSIDFCLQDSATFDENVLYRWDDSQVWDDSKFWVDSENLEETFWKITWFWDENEIQWARSVDS